MASWLDEAGTGVKISVHQLGKFFDRTLLNEPAKQSCFAWPTDGLSQGLSAMR
jgi:hypothetical protein